MAVNNTAKTYSNMEFPLSMKRQDAFSLDPTCVWPSMADAQNYAKTNPTATSVRSSPWSWTGLPPRTPSRTPPVISPRWALRRLTSQPILR